MNVDAWLAVMAIVVGVLGAQVGWMLRISRQLTRLESLVHRVDSSERRLQRHSDKIDSHATRLAVIESHAAEG